MCVCLCVTLTNVVTGAQTDGSVFYSLWFWLQLWMLFEVCGNKVVARNPISLNSPSLSIKWCGLLWFLWGFCTLTRHGTEDRSEHRPIRRGLFTKWNGFYKLDYSFCYILHDSCYASDTGSFLAYIWCIKHMHWVVRAANNWHFLCSAALLCCFCCLSQSIHTIMNHEPFGVRVNLVDSVMSETCL